jgi:hypothetical protein
VQILQAKTRARKGSQKPSIEYTYSQLSIQSAATRPVVQSQGVTPRAGQISIGADRRGQITTILVG